MIPRRHRGETPIEILCRRCCCESYHVERRGNWRCLTCGCVNDPNQLPLLELAAEEASARPPEKGGSRGGRKPNQPLGATTASRCSPTASHPQREAAEDPLTGIELEAHDRDPRLARYIYAAAGLELDNTTVQTWQVGNHELRVRAWPDRSRRYVLRIEAGWPTRLTRHSSKQPPTGLALGEVHAIATANQLHLPRGPELGRWKRRALVDAGIISPHPVTLPQLPPNAPRSAQQTWNAIGELLQVRYLVDPVDEPVPLSSPFLAHWSGLPQSTLERGKTWLERHGLITRAGHAPFGWPAPCLLWQITTAKTQADTEAPT